MGPDRRAPKSSTPTRAATRTPRGGRTACTPTASTSTASNGCPRQYDTALALILFGDRVRETELDIAPATIPMPLALGLGFDNVQDLADRADITIT